MGQLLRPAWNGPLHLSEGCPRARLPSKAFSVGRPRSLHVQTLFHSSPANPGGRLRQFCFGKLFKSVPVQWVLWPYKARRDAPLDPLLGAQTRGNALGNARGFKLVPGKGSGITFGTKRSGKQCCPLAGPNASGFRRFVPLDAAPSTIGPCVPRWGLSCSGTEVSNGSVWPVFKPKVKLTSVQNFPVYIFHPWIFLTLLPLLVFDCCPSLAEIKVIQ